MGNKADLSKDQRQVQTDTAIVSESTAGYIIPRYYLPLLVKIISRVASPIIIIIILFLIQEFAHQHDMLFFETSCKDGTNVELAVMTVVAKILEGTTTKRKHKLKSEDSRSCCIA